MRVLDLDLELICVRICCILVLISCGTASAQWRNDLNASLSAFGHRNWIVIADQAYPKQSAPGINTLFIDSDHLEVLDLVLRKVQEAPHVQAVLMLDAELEHVPESDAPGIEAYRDNLNKRLQGLSYKTMLHEAIIAKLDESANLFNVLILKTNMVLPYTSVFIELDCGYWDSEREILLREAMEGQ